MGTYKDEPSKKLEKELREHPNDKSKQVDVGLDESMDASDPVSASRPGDDKVHPSTNAPRSDEEE